MFSVVLVPGSVVPDVPDQLMMFLDRLMFDPPDVRSFPLVPGSVSPDVPLVPVGMDLVDYFELFQLLPAQLLE
jgi:hypothetical protein